MFSQKKINRTKSIFLNFLFQFIGNLCFVATSEYFIRYNYTLRSPRQFFERCLLLITHRLHSIDCTINCFVARTWPAPILYPSSPSRRLRRCINNKKRELSRDIRVPSKKITSPILFYYRNSIPFTFRGDFLLLPCLLSNVCRGKGRTRMPAKQLRGGSDGGESL